jgi:hypothetical protein
MTGAMSRVRTSLLNIAGPRVATTGCPNWLLISLVSCRVSVIAATSTPVAVSVQISLAVIHSRALARDIGLVPCTTPIQSPQSNGMAEAFVKLIKRDYARVSPTPDASSVLRQLDSWFEHYNSVHPHKALGYRSPREFRKQIVEKTTENAVGAVRRSHESTTATEAVGSRPQPPQAVARSASLDASAAVDHP